MKETLRQRIGVDVGRRVSAEEAVEWAAQMKFILISKPILHRTPWKVLMIHVAAKSGKVVNNTVCILGYTLSGVNIAEISPHLRKLPMPTCEIIDLSVKLGAEWIVVHGGYHFTGCQKIRKQASIDRIKRAVEYAEKQNALLLLENLNGEPELPRFIICPIIWKIPKSILSRSSHQI